MPTFHIWCFWDLMYLALLLYLSSVDPSARLDAAGNRPCWKDTSQLIMTGHHKSPATFAAWRSQCDLAGSPWQMADLAGDWHLYHPSAPSALPLLCKGCQSQPLLLWFPAPSLPALLPQLAPYASHMEKCHSPLALHTAAKLPGCSPSPLSPFSLSVTLFLFFHLFSFCHHFPVCSHLLE